MHFTLFPGPRTVKSAKPGPWLTSMRPAVENCLFAFYPTFTLILWLFKRQLIISKDFFQYIYHKNLHFTFVSGGSIKYLFEVPFQTTHFIGLVQNLTVLLICRFCVFLCLILPKNVYLESHELCKKDQEKWTRKIVKQN